MRKKKPHIVRLIIGSGVLCYNLPKSAKRKIKEDLAFDNPEYKSALEQGRYIRSDMDSHIRLYEASKKKYWIPRGYIYYLIKFLKSENYVIKYSSRVVEHPEMDISFKGELRPYQQKAMKDMVSYPVGVLVAATGGGKTVIALGIIANRKQPTLIIVHNKELLYQWMDQIKKFLGIDCGIVGDGKFNIKPITVGIINTVRNKTEELNPHFGQVICDECHRVSASTWGDTIQEFSAKHYMGLTATPFRRDGLGEAIFASLGPMKHTVSKKMLLDTGAVLTPKIIRVETGFRLLGKDGRPDNPDRIEYSTMLKMLTEDPYRNQLIATGIHRDIKKYNENVLVVSDRVKHCRDIKLLLNSDKITCYILTGSTKKSEREYIVREVKAGRCQVLISTLSLVGEGFDVPDLSALFLTTPVKFAGRVIQTCGRVLRPKKDKKPRIYDYRDTDIPVLRYSGFNRDRIYKKEWK